MAAQEYKAVSWSDNEPVFTKKLNQMTANDQWLFENSPRMFYNAYSVKRHEGIKIACGLHLMEPSPSGIQQSVVYFGSFFSAGCHPVIVTDLVHQGEVRIHFGHKGIGVPHPDHRGFELLGGSDQLNTKINRMTKRFYISWIAMGY